MAIRGVWGLSTLCLAQGVHLGLGDMPKQPPPLKVRGSTKPMPAVGFGTCCRPTAIGKAVVKSTETYLALGGRLIDTAQKYSNHRDLAQAIREAGLPREELWITSKVDPQAAKSTEDVVRAVDSSLSELGLTYIDLMLLHWGGPPEKNAAQWQGLINAKRAGKVRSIGVSNYNPGMVELLVKATGEMPAVNQLEYHPWVPAGVHDTVRWCQAQGITVTAYGSLGTSSNKAQGDAVSAVAKRYSVGNAQVLLQWALQKGTAVIPGATSEGHIREDLDLADVRLSDEDMRLLEGAEKPKDFLAVTGEDFLIWNIR